MKDFFKFDDKRIVSTLLFSISGILFILSILTLEVIEVFIVIVETFMITVIGGVFTLNEGIHFNYKKEKIIIVKGMTIQTIHMKDVKYISIEEISKNKKGNIIQKFVDPINQIHLPSKYVYNNGKVFDIVFYMKKIGNIKIYYGWLYRTTSIKRINRQLENFKKIKDNFLKYKNY